VADRKGAVLSDCESYRYALWRELPNDSLLDEFHCPILGKSFAVNDGSPDSSYFTQDETCLFVMLNPSTANAVETDNTLDRCIAFAHRWGFGRLSLANLYAFRTPYPRELAMADDPVGPENDDWICELANDASFTVVAWGAAKEVESKRASDVLYMLDHDQGVSCLGLTKDGHPEHPLYLPKDRMPVAFEEDHYRQVYGVKADRG